MADRRPRTDWGRMVQALEELDYFARVAPAVLRPDERDWPAVVWLRTGGVVIPTFEGEGVRTSVLLAFIAGSFVDAEAAREKGIAALEQKRLLAAPPDPPFDEYEDELEGVDSESCSGSFVCMQEVVLR